MENIPLYYFVVVGFTIIFSAFFSGIEVAFVTANELKLEIEGKSSSKFPKILNKLFIYNLIISFINNFRKYICL